MNRNEQGFGKADAIETENFSLTYYDEFGHKCNAQFTVNEYHSLMELLFDKYIEEWGDCKGRAWCGTCHIEILEDNLTEKIDEDEKQTLAKINNTTDRSRLACQIPLNTELNGAIFKILKDDQV